MLLTFVRIFGNLNDWLAMISLKSPLCLIVKAAMRCVVLGGLLIIITGCQQLFHAQDAPLKGQAVTVSMTLPEKPLPALKPLQQEAEKTLSQKQAATTSLDSRLLPTQSPSPAGLLTLKTSPEPAKTLQIKPARIQVLKAATVLPGKTVAEDMVLRGTVLIRGSLVIAPQATLRIDPGTIIKLAPATDSEELPRIVVQGRIIATGTVQQPIVLGPAFNEPAAGDWGGIVLLNSEKKNSLEHCRIVGAQTGLEAHFSRFSGHGITVVRSHSGIVLFDSEASLLGSTIHRCDTGYKLSDSELDLRDSTVRENRLGIVAQHSSFTLTSVKIVANSQEGVFADHCRFKFSGSRFAENRCGIRLTSGDGQIFLCRFDQNRENGVELTGVRIRINNSSFTRNAGVGIILENARGSVVGSAFSDNRGGNLQSRGGETFAALLNWWGSVDERLVAASIMDHGRKDSAALVSFVPFLKERPTTAP